MAHRDRALHGFRPRMKPPAVREVDKWCQSLKNIKPIAVGNTASAPQQPNWKANGNPLVACTHVPGPIIQAEDNAEEYWMGFVDEQHIRPPARLLPGAAAVPTLQFLPQPPQQQQQQQQQQQHKDGRACTVQATGIHGKSQRRRDDDILLSLLDGGGLPPAADATRPPAPVHRAQQKTEHGLVKAPQQQGQWQQQGVAPWLTGQSGMQEQVQQEHLHHSQQQPWQEQQMQPWQKQCKQQRAEQQVLNSHPASQQKHQPLLNPQHAGHQHLSLHQHDQQPQAQAQQQHLVRPAQGNRLASAGAVAAGSQPASRQQPPLPMPANFWYGNSNPQTAPPAPSAAPSSTAPSRASRGPVQATLTANLQLKRPVSDDHDSRWKHELAAPVASAGRAPLRPSSTANQRPAATCSELQQGKHNTHSMNPEHIAGHAAAACSAVKSMTMSEPSRKARALAAAEGITGSSVAGAKRGKGAAAKQQATVPGHNADDDAAKANAAGDQEDLPLAKRRRTSGTAASASSPDASEQLRFNDMAKNALESLQDFAGALLQSDAVVLALLYANSSGNMVQFSSSTQELDKQQLAKLRKAKRQAKSRMSGGGKAPASAADAAVLAVEADADISSRVVGIGILCIDAANHQQCSASAINCSDEADAMQHRNPLWYLPLDAATGEAAAQITGHLVQLVTDPSRPAICCNAKDMLREISRCGVALPRSRHLCVVDPLLLAWLSEPQLVQRDEKELDSYSLLPLLARYMATSCMSDRSQDQGAAAAAALERRYYGLKPLQRLRLSLQHSMQLADAMTQVLQAKVPARALMVEMQVMGILAAMEAHGMACEPACLLAHKQQILSRIAAINKRALELVGRQVNLASPSQLAQLLYQELKLPVPSNLGNKGAKTHTPTDEAALKQLHKLHELPGLVLEHRCMANILTKWLEPEWVKQLASEAAAAGSSYGRLCCSWNQNATATGRLSSSSPNLQAVTKYTVQAHYQQQSNADVPISAGSGSSCIKEINIRDAFAAPAGHVLLAADYSQMELRILAHLSKDTTLAHLLRQEGDAFSMIASTWLAPGQPPSTISKDQRELAKRVTYGICYGQTPFGLAGTLAGQGINTAGAAKLLSSFLNTFKGVKAFVDSSNRSAAERGFVTTLLGRRRPLRELQSASAKERSDGQRKVVNSMIQGSAADLVKLVMCKWDDWCADQEQQQQHGFNPPARLVAQIHDELLFEVSDEPQAVQQVTQAVREIMQGAIKLDVPLLVKISLGSRWGSMVEEG